MCYIFDYKNIFEYKDIFYGGMGWAWVNQHSMHLHSVTLSKCCILVDDYHIYRKHQLNCLHNYRSPSFAFLHQHLSSFSAVFYLVTTVKFYKTIFRFNLFNLPIDHLHKLISPLSIEFVRIELSIHYVCIPMYCDIFASGLLLITETTKKLWIKLI